MNLNSQVGKPTSTSTRVASYGGGEDLEVGFTIFPLNLESGPSFDGANRVAGNEVHVDSLHSNFDVANPVSRQTQATFFVSPIPLPPPPPPKVRPTLKVLDLAARFA